MSFKDKFWDAVIWISLLIIFVWVLLKSFGIIHSPVWIEMIPYYGVLGFLLGVIYKAGKIVQFIKEIKKKVDLIGNKLDNIEDRFIKVEHEHNLCMQGKLNVHG